MNNKEQVRDKSNLFFLLSKTYKDSTKLPMEIYGNKDYNNIKYKGGENGNRIF